MSQPRAWLAKKTAWLTRRGVKYYGFTPTPTLLNPLNQELTPALPAFDPRLDLSLGDFVASQRPRTLAGAPQPSIEGVKACQVSENTAKHPTARPIVLLDGRPGWFYALRTC